MSHKSNVLISEFKRERNQGAFSVVIPQGTIYTDSYLEREAKEKEREEMKNWNESEGDNDIY